MGYLDKYGLYCPENISREECHQRIQMLIKRTVPKEFLHRSKDMAYFDSIDE